MAVTETAGAESQDYELCLLWRCSPGALGSVCGPEGGCLSEPGKRRRLLQTPGVPLALGRLERALQLVPRCLHNHLSGRPAGGSPRIGTSAPPLTL